MASLTPLQKQQLSSILPKITAFLSWTGSLSIVVDIVRKYRKRNPNSRHNSFTTYHRLMLGMSLFDMACSGGHSMTTWPIPADTPNTYATYGNEATCKAQAFFIQLGLGAPCYNLCLAIYYYLLIVRNTPTSRFWERIMHAVCVVCAFGTAVAALALDYYGNAIFWCWIEGKYDLARWLFWYGPLWFIIASVAVIMGALYWNMLETERRQMMHIFAIRTASSGRSMNTVIRASNANRGSNSMKWQAFLYVGSFFLTWIFLTVVRGMQAVGNGSKIPYWLYLTAGTFVTCQGSFNLLIYLRGKYNNHRERHPEVGRIMTFLRIHPLFSSCMCWPKLSRPNTNLSLGQTRTGYSTRVTEERKTVVSMIEMKANSRNAPPESESELYHSAVEELWEDNAEVDGIGRESESDPEAMVQHPSEGESSNKVPLDKSGKSVRWANND